MRKTMLVSSLILFSLLFISVFAEEHVTNLYVFYGEGCPHCANEIAFLDSISPEYPSLNVQKYDVNNDEEGYNLFLKMADSYGFDPMGVPTTFIGDDYFVGYLSDDTTGSDMLNSIQDCIENGCTDPADKLDSGVSTTTVQIGDIDIPFLENLDISQISLPALTIVIGLLDGFNPCAMFVLCFLLVFLIGTSSRKKVFIIGGVFLFISALVYFLFITAWFNFFKIFKYVPILKAIVSVAVIIAGLVNIKDYFIFQKGISFTLPKKWKPKIENRIRNIVKLETFPAMIAGVVAVALVVNLVELMCTIGFPMIYTQILATYNLSKAAYYSYILLYCLFYMIDDFLLFAVAVVTLRCFEMTKDRVRLMKLISGLLMIALALWFLLN